MKPTMGRIVLYVSPEGVVRPAIVIAPCSERFPGSNYTRDECQLHVFFDQDNDATKHGVPFAWRISVPHDENKAPGSWHWPPRV